MQKTVYVGLSGGVDSAVSAALLQREGHRVVGVFIKIWQPEFLECTWKSDRLAAMRVAAALGIPFREIDLSEAYQKLVITRMIDDYAQGITPNPDVLCNQHIKFGAFLEWALQSGAHMVATGHYARTRHERNGETVLLRGVDQSKDQSYFLHRLTAAQLEHTRFPIGEMEKPQVRELARTFGLPSAERPDSQGLCFVGDITLADFLRRFISIESGSVLDPKGEPIGEHRGAALYTIGQRHGFQVRGPHGSKPHYVTSIDTKSNTITVSPQRLDAERKTAALIDLHLIHERSLPLQVVGQTRYREIPSDVEIRKANDYISATFAVTHLLSPGQSLVLYEGDECLGGGIIGRS